MKVIQMTPQDQASVKALKEKLQAAQVAYINVHQQLLAHLQNICGVKAEPAQGRKTRLSVSDCGNFVTVA